MYKIDYKKIKKAYGGYRFSLPFFLFGIFFLAIEVSAFFELGIKPRLSMDSEVRAYDVEIETDEYNKKAIYHYVVNGEEYSCIINLGDGSFSFEKIKNKNTIYYDSKNPKNCLSEYEQQPFSWLIALVFPLPFIWLGLHEMIKLRKYIKKIKWLAQNGTLIKGLKYEWVQIGSGEDSYTAIQIDYSLPSGSIIKLRGNSKRFYRNTVENETVDLLIDINNIENYYIDFNIDQDFE